jgi:hypothetical protein
MLSDGTMDFIVTAAVILVFIWIVASMVGVNLGELMVGMRSTKRVQVDAEPRDQAERWLNNHRKSARDSKPPVLKYAWLTGDLDVPPIKIGKIVGLEAHEEGYLAYIKTSRLAWSKPYILIRPLCSDANRRNLWIHSRGVSTNGLYRWAIEPSNIDINPSEAVDMAHALFDTLLDDQVLVDGKEDGAWATATGIMPKEETRIQKAEASVPHTTERPYTPEEAAR